MKLIGYSLAVLACLYQALPFYAQAQDLTQENHTGKVDVTITYQNPGEANPAFDVQMKSIVINLRRYDLATLSLLKDDMGNEYKGTWTLHSGTMQRLHGTLVFEGDKVQNAKEIELTIESVGRTEKRTFRWRLKES